MKIQNKLPLFYPLLALLLGIIYQEFLPSNSYVLIIVILLNISFLIKAKTRVFAYSLIFFSGALLLCNQKNKNNALIKFLKNKNINLIGTVSEKETINSSHIKEEILFNVKKINYKQQTKNTNFNLLCYTYTPTKIIPGQEIEIKNAKVKQDKTNQDFKYYLLRKNILSTFFSNKLQYNLINNNKHPTAKKLYQLKNDLYKRIKNKLEKKCFNYFSSIFLGNKKNNITTEEKNQFNIWGISHYLARSGLHIAIFVLIWQLLLTLLPIPLRIKNILMIIIITLYMLLSWTSISFLRAYYIFILYQVSNLINKQTNFIHLLLAICVLILIKNPIQLFFIDFQLTFILTFTLALIGKLKIQNVKE